MKTYLNIKKLNVSAVLSACLIGGMIFMTGCSGKSGSGDETDGTDGTDPTLSLCSTPIEASLSDGLDRIGGATTSVALVDVADINYTLYNTANELRITSVDNPSSDSASLGGVEVEGYIHDIETVVYNGTTYAILAMGQEGITAVEITDSGTLNPRPDLTVQVNYNENNITWTEGSGTIVPGNTISSSRAPISSLAVYNEGNSTSPSWQLIIGDEGYGLHKTALENFFMHNLDTNDNTLLIDGPEEYTLQYAGENPWGGPKSLTLYGEGNSTRLFVAQGFMGMGIYKPDTLEHVGHYNLYTDATEDNHGEDFFYDMNISAIASTDSCTGMPDYTQVSLEISGTTTETPWAEFENKGYKYYYDARDVDVAKFNDKSYAYIAYGLAGLVAVDVSDYNTTTDGCMNTGKYLGYVPAMPVKGPEDGLIGHQGGGGGSGSDIFSRAGSGMLKDAGVIDVKVDMTSNKVFFTDHFAGLMVVNDANDSAASWHGPLGLYAYDNDDTNKTQDHIPSYDFVTSYDMNASSSDEEALPKFTTEEPILLTTGEVGGHGNSLALTGSSFDLNDTDPADVIMAAGAGGLNFIEVFKKLTDPNFYDFNVTEHFATTDETGAAPDGYDTPEISVGHSAGVGTFDNILYLADGPHGMMAWKVAEIVDGNCQNIATDQVRLVGNTLQSEGAIGEINPTPHADEVMVIDDGVNKSAMVASLSAGLRRVNVNVMGTEDAPALLYPTAGDIFEHSSGDTETKLGGIQFEDRVYDVEVRGNLAFTADGLSGVTVYNLNQIPDGNNPNIIVDNIKQEKGLQINNATGIALWGDYAFVAGGSTGIAVIKINQIGNDQVNLSIVKSFQPIKWEDLEAAPKAHNADGVAVDVKIMDGFAFFTYDSFGVLAYRISDLINPDYANPYDAQNRPDALGYFKIQNATTYTNNVGTDFADWSGGASGIDAITTTDGKKLVYVAYGDAGVVKLDWSTLWTSPAPANSYDTISPILEDHANTAGSATDVSVWYGRAYVADGAGGLVLMK